jgi:tetratricopeptide (TPR) repeat protein
VVSETPEGRVHETITRLCRNDGRARYEGRIHEQLVAPGRSGETGLVCRHQGYTEEAVLRKDKIARNLRLLRRALEDAPDDAYLRFQLGRTLWRAGGVEGDEALEQLGAAVAAAPPGAPWAAGALRDLGHALREAGRLAEALALAARGRAAHPDFTDLAFLEGLLHLDLGDAVAMLSAFETCLALGETRRYTSVEGVGSYRAHHNLGLFRELSGDPARARAHYEAALAAAPDFVPSRERPAGLSGAASAARSAR